MTLGLETSPPIRAAYGPALAVFDALVRAVFVLEIAAKLYGRGRAFSRDPWNVFDFLVVGIALIPARGPFSVLRALRILRIMRLDEIALLRGEVVALREALGAPPGSATRGGPAN